MFDSLLKDGRMAVAKYKDLQEPKSEADMKYLEAEREVGEVRIFFTFERNLT